MAESRTEIPGAGESLPAPEQAPIAAEPLQYVTVDRQGPPGLVTAIGVCSIIIAGISVLFSAMVALQGLAYFVMSLVAPAVATAGAPRPMPPGPVVVGTAAQVGSRGMAPAERAAAVASLNRRLSMRPSRRRQLDAILALAGQDMATDQIVESGTMEVMRSGEDPPDYFVTARGRLELFNDRAVFYPANRAPVIRASAPPEGASTPDQLPVPAEDVALQQTAPAQATTVPAPVTSPAAPGALSPSEIQAIVQQAQSVGSNALNRAQSNALKAILSAPAQQFVTPGASAGAVAAAFKQPDGSVSIQFSEGASLVLGPQGQVKAMTTGVTFPSVSIHPVAIGLMLATALASIGLAIYLLVCGILMLRQSLRGRRLHLIYAAIKIPVAIAAGVAATWVERELATNSAALGGVGVGVFSGLVPALLALAYPVALLLVLNLREVREYFAVGTGAGQGPSTTSA